MLKIFGNKHSHGGAKVPHHKNTADMQTVVMPDPDKVTLVMSQHIGKHCAPIVEVGDKVYKGQLIAETDAFVSAPIHASITGTVEEIKVITTAAGAKARAVVIKKSEEEENIWHDQVKEQSVNDYDEFIRAVKSSGIVGLGGAGFPTSVKLKPADLSKIDYLIVNGAECEPYITADYREMIENTEQVEKGIRIIKDKLNIKNVCIGIENNKPDAIKKFSDIFKDNSDINVKELRARYPQGAEKVLIYECVQRVVPEGKLPSDVGCIVINVSTVSAICRYIDSGIPLISKRITVDGGAVNSPKNILAPIGTSIKDIIEFCGGYKSSPDKLLMGGPMMGRAIENDTFPIEKTTNAILALTEEECKVGKQTQCMRCGRCIDACPINLMPASFERAMYIEDIDQLRYLKVQLCMECGTCSYVCPAKRDLVDSIKKAKELLRKKK